VPAPPLGFALEAARPLELLLGLLVPTAPGVAYGCRVVLPVAPDCPEVEGVAPELVLPPFIPAPLLGLAALSCWVPPARPVLEGPHRLARPVRPRCAECGHGLLVDLSGSLQSFPLLELHERRSGAGAQYAIRLAQVEPSLVENLAAGRSRPGSD
jgi:hypothetical protein